ncbi:uncharacterized protein HD556DRAFT_1446064 [Suillus plorans]|uniref:Uncharacterized protein n=1 Tax=Suillus plorans TaxID=116603 RepID=A0A9P7DFJ4_9AGAM|nr:uncharacterized protein HD556DRAFT_1446064 [Suillus plorans]KAG1790542.1 hypothetical protein HD556DRAFT_1446064 [Suillus plorans]
MPANEQPTGGDSGPAGNSLVSEPISQEVVPPWQLLVSVAGTMPPNIHSSLALEPAQVDPVLGGLKDITMDDSEYILPAVKGQRHNETNDILREGFNRNHTCGINSVNHWNTYSGYFKDNLKQELARLGDKAPDIPGTPSVTTILECHDQSIILSGVPQTVAMRAQEFQKFCKKIITVMDGGAVQFGFEVALVACGKVINQDGGLSLACTTPGAAGISSFFRFASDLNILHSHNSGSRVVQVYNLSSLVIVEEAFLGDNDVTEPDVNNECEASFALTDTINISKDGTRWIKAEISCQLRGIAALKVGTMRLKKVLDSLQGKILASECPVVEGAHPPVDSIHVTGHYLFTNGTSNHKGLACKKPSKALTKRKRKIPQKAPAFRPSPISLSDDCDSDAPPAPPIKPIGPPPFHEFKIVVLPKQQKKVKKIAKVKEVISLISSDAQSGSEDDTAKDNTNYEDKAASNKRQAKSEGSSQAAKKRASSPEAHVPKYPRLFQQWPKDREALKVTAQSDLMICGSFSEAATQSAFVSLANC